MADIKVQRGITDFGASADTATATITAVNNVNRAMVRITNIFTHASSGATAGFNGFRQNDDIGMNVVLTNTTTITFTRLAAGQNEDVRVHWEVWEDDEQGDNSFIVRHHADITLSDGTATVDTTVSGITTIADCVPFILGVTNDGTGSEWDDATVTAEIIFDSPNNVVRIKRDGTSDDTIVSICVVEFTGSNWDVQNNIEHTFSVAATNETETITAVVWNNTFIESSHRAPSNEDNLDAVTSIVWPGSTTTTVRFRQQGSTLGVTVAHVVENSGAVVEHLDSITGGGTQLPVETSEPQSETRTISSVTLADSGVIATGATNLGFGNYHRGGWGYLLQDSTTLEFWRSIRQNTTDWAAQIITFPGPASPVIPFQVGQVLGDAILPVEVVPKFFPVINPSSAAPAAANPVIPFIMAAMIFLAPAPLEATPHFFPVINPPIGELEQSDFHGRNDKLGVGTLNSTLFQGAAGQNQNWNSPDASTFFRCRFLVKETSGKPITGAFVFRASDNGGPYAELSGSTFALSVSTDDFAPADATSQVLGSGSFVACPSGGIEATNLTTGEVTLQSQETEVEIVFLVNSSNVVVGDTIDIRLYRELPSGSIEPFATYTNTPRITIHENGLIKFSVTPLVEEYESGVDPQHGSEPRFFPVINPPNGSLEQSDFHGRNGGPETTTLNSTVFQGAAGQNQNWNAPGDSASYPFRIRFLVKETSGQPRDAALIPEFSKNGGAFVLFDNTSGPLRTVTTNGYTGGDATTQVLGSGSFVAGEGLAGATAEDGTSTISFAANEETEVELSIRVIQGENVNGDFYDVRLRDTAGPLLETYTNTPRITVHDNGPVTFSVAPRVDPEPAEDRGAKSHYFPVVNPSTAAASSPVIPFVSVGRVLSDKTPPLESAPKYFPFIDFTFETHPNIPFRVMPPTAPPELHDIRPKYLPFIDFTFETHPNIPIIYGRIEGEQDLSIENFPFVRPNFNDFVFGNAPPITYVTAGYGSPIIQIDPTLYPAATTFYLEAVLKSGAGTAAARLFNITDAAVVASSEVTTTSTSFVRLRSVAITLPAGAREYRIEPGFSTGDTTTVRGGRVIVSI